MLKAICDSPGCPRVVCVSGSCGVHWRAEAIKLRELVDRMLPLLPMDSMAEMTLRAELAGR